MRTPLNAPGRLPRPYRPILALVTVLALCLVGASAAARANATTTGTQGTATGTQGSNLSATSLWPRFSTPQTVLAADATELSNDDMLTATTLEGLYNATQRSSRLYLIRQPEDQFWLTQLPARVHVETIAPAGQQSLVQTLLERFRAAIHGAIVIDPSNADTVNLATSMAGLDHAVVIDPSQQAMVTGLGIKVLYSFDTPAFTADNAVQTYQWGVQNLLPRTSTRLLIMLPGTNPGDVRDYAVATKTFMFYLTSTDPAQQALMGTILAHTPANTPVMGYIPNENPDVAYLSSHGHFLNASDLLTNETVWASVPSPAFLRQGSEPAPLVAQPNTVYVAFLVSDGDNAQYMQHRMAEVWQGPDVGSVPEGWTVAPGTEDFAPTLLQYYIRHLPGNSELAAGPSGIGYATQMSGSDLTRFAELSGEIMRQADLHTVDSWETIGNVDPEAQALGVPSLSSEYRSVEHQVGNTIVFGQTSGYIDPAQSLFCTIHQQSAELRPGQPLFIEPLVDAWNEAPADVLHIAQQLALAAHEAGLRYVFTTPTELALTMQRYYAGREGGLPSSNAQSMTGEQTLAEPIVSPSYPSSPVRITGPNLVTNPSGASGTTGWTTSGGSLTATTYQGHPALNWTSDITTGPSWASYYPAVQNGSTYTFSVDVAGSGQVYLDVYNGTVDATAVPVKLTSGYQRLTWTLTIPGNAPTGQTGNAPQLQVRSSGAGPVSVDITNASVAASTSPC